MEKLQRRDKINYYLDLAETVSQRCTCLRKHYGAVIVKNDEVISTGYVGAPRGRQNCSDLGYCLRTRLGVPRESGTSCAAASTPRPTPSSALSVTICWEAPFIWWGKRWKPVNM